MIKNEIAPNQAKNLNAIFLDVRTQAEIESGKIAGSIAFEYDQQRKSFSKDLKQLQLSNKNVVVYCRSGQRSQAAIELLEKEFPEFNFSNLAGGIEAWSQAGFVTETESKLSQSELERYSRQILLPELGLEGQEKLKDSKVLILGLGGLGSPVALYLAAAGVNLGFVDDDLVDKSNLQRQVVHAENRIGENKALSARQAVQELNPDIEVEIHQERLGPDNVFDLLEKYDLIVDGTDNFPTRYLLNDVSVRLGKPVVSASILGFSGQTTSFVPGGPCYACLYPSPPPPELAPSCSAAGVLGVMAGTVGLFQATEAVKILTGIGKPLAGQLLLYDALEAEFQKLNYRKDPNCMVCSNSNEDRPLPDYQEFCQLRPAAVLAG